MQTTWNKGLVLTIVAIASLLLYFLSPVLTPFLIAALLAYLADPIVERLILWRVPRLLSVIIVFMSLFGVLTLLILLLIPLVQKQLVTLTEVIPRILSWAQDSIYPWLEETFGIEEKINVETIKATLAQNWVKAGNVATWLVKTTLHSGMAIVEWITTLLLVPVVTFYLLRDWKIVLRNARSLLPRNIEPTLVGVLMECDAVLSAFFRGQLLVMLSLGLIYSVGLSMIGLQIGLIIGLVSGLASIVPYLGFIVGISTASIAAYVQFGTFTSILLVWVVFAVGQALESTLLTPKLVGDRIGLHPVAVIFAVLAGGKLFGFFGVLLALPVAAVIMVLLRFIHQKYRNSYLYKA